MRFAGKAAIVTGAGQGIGRAIAIRLAADGAAVVIAEYHADAAAAVADEIRRADGRAVAYPVDVSSATAVRTMAEEVARDYGRIDILVNNAGVTQTKPLLELTEADWDRITATNERGLFFCLQAVAARMVRQAPEASQSPEALQARSGAPPSAGKIVNISSISGRRGRPLSAHYAASKAAVISITQSAALALAPYRINVNAVCPGVIDTPMWEQIDRDRARLFGLRPGEAMAAFVETIPLKRAGTPDEVAAAVAFLCSADADYMTGQTLHVDGGYEML